MCVRMAASQFGLISAAQLKAIGLSREALRHAVRSGRLALFLPGVYEIPGAPHSWDRNLMAMHLWAGDESAASGQAAGRKWDFNGFKNAPIEVSTTQRKKFTGCLPDGVPAIVHRVDNHLLREIVLVGNMPVTSPRKTILDLAAKRHRLAESALDSALRRELTDIGQLWLLLEQEWMHRRRGVAILRNLVIPRTLGMAPSDSELELMARRVIDKNGLPEPIHQHPVVLPSGPKRIDLAYRTRCLPSSSTAMRGI
jgi:hypothetical protein